MLCTDSVFFQLAIESALFFWDFNRLKIEIAMSSKKQFKTKTNEAIQNTQHWSWNSTTPKNISNYNISLVCLVNRMFLVSSLVRFDAFNINSNLRSSTHWVQYYCSERTKFFVIRTITSTNRRTSNPPHHFGI